MDRRPEGVVTFLFTDIEGSTRRWEADAAAMRIELEAHDDALRRAVEGCRGWLFKHTGDGVCAAFERPGDALEAAAEAQRCVGLPVRMGIATGEADRRGDDYFGPTLNQVARVMGCAHGGQVLVAGSTVSLVDGFDLVDLGVHRLRDLTAPVGLWQLVGDGLGREFPSLRTVDPAPGNLPRPSTTLLGRDDTVAAVAEALESAPLVTLVGVGGVGKTRLALEVAHTVADRFPDGAWLVELAAVLDGSDVADSVAAIFSIAPPADGDWATAVIDALTGRRLLLVLDNCEHVLDGVVGMVDGLAARAPDVRVLATSREGLGTQGELAWPVLSLATGPGSVASRLFAERVAAVAPDVDLSGHVEDIAEIGERLDGIPLAIELAAARVRSMSPAQIRGHLDERFRLLTGARRSTERHQTLRAAVQWSYQLLSESETALLDAVSVFVGGFDLEAAIAVCGAAVELDEFEALDLLDSLVRKSLLQVDRSGPGVRYELLETIRQFAEERLADRGTAAATRDRHAAHFAERAEAAFAVFRSPAEAEAYAFVDREIANLRAAFEWAAEAPDPDAAVRIAACTHEIARFRLRTEAMGWSARVVDRARDAGHRLLPLLLTMACDGAWSRGELEEAEALGREAVAVADDARYEPFVWAYSDLATIAFYRGDVDRGIELLHAGADHPADEHDRFMLSLALFYRMLMGRPLPEAELERAVAHVEAGGFPTAIAGAWGAESQALADRDPARAEALGAKAVELLQTCGNRLLERTAWAVLATRAASEGDPRQALTAFSPIVDAWAANGDAALARAMLDLARLLADLGDDVAASRILGAVNRIVALAEAADLTTQLRHRMGDARFEAELEIGASHDLAVSADLAHEAIQRARSAVDG
ncbi:MAG: adenylate/guanylate cyclase domain-containing protein [Acidimicrobiales bacterium]|nr:adenylate/guanylate cyclase domain-containing protein [Acidimicrobiales bacterium]